MSETIAFHFDNLQNLLLPPTIIELAAAVLILALVVFSLYLLTKLKSARAIIGQLAKSLGYEPPYGDGSEIFEQEYKKEIVENGREKKIEQLEERIVGFEREIANKDAESAAHRQRSTELEGQLAEALAENERAAARVDELVRAHQTALEHMELHMREKEAESHANLAAVQEHSKELQDQLQQASAWGNKITTMANDQAQAHRTLVEQMEEHMREMEAQHISDLTAHHRRAKELEDRLQLASFQHEQITMQASEQLQAHQEAVVQLEQRIRQMEMEGQAYLSALERHAKELEERLQLAQLQNDQLAGQANAQADVHRAVVSRLEERIRQTEAGGGAHVESLEQRLKELEAQLTAQASQHADARRTAVEEFEHRIGEIEARGAAAVAAHQQRSIELEEELRRAVIRQDGIAAQASEQTQAYRTTIDNLEQRIRDLEAEGIASSSAILQRTKELEEQLRQVQSEKDAAAAQAGEQAQAHQSAIEEHKERIRQMEAESSAAMSGHEQRSRELEEQLRQVQHDKDTAAWLAGEQLQVHKDKVEQLEQRLREMENERGVGLEALHHRAKELEEQLQLAHHEKEAASVLAGEQSQAHKSKVEQLEQRLREMEAENGAGLEALHHRVKELEEQLQQAQQSNESDKAHALQELMQRNVDKERLEQRIRDLESEKGGGAAQVQSLEAKVKVLEEQLRAASLANVAVAETPTVNAKEATAAELLRRAEWMTACAVGEILPHGLVAAEAYASAALVGAPHDAVASQLVAELARIHRAYQAGLPSAAESIATFEQKAATYFAADPSLAADLAQDEAKRRARAGLNRSALLSTNLALELRQKVDASDSPGMVELRELKATLVERLGQDATMTSPSLQS